MRQKYISKKPLYLCEMVKILVISKGPVGLLTGILVFRGLIQYLDWDSLEVGDILVPGLFIIHGLMPLGCALSACTRETYWLESAFFLLVFYFVINLKAVFPGRSVLKGLLVYLYLLSTTLFYLILDRFAPILDWTDRFLAVAVFLLGMVGLLRYWNGLKSITREDLRLELTFRSRLKRRPLTMQNLPSVNMSLPRQFIKQMRYKLLHQEKKLEEEITLIEKEDPFKDVERAENNAELVAEAAEQSGHIFIDMQVKFMRDTLKMVQGALDRIRRGWQADSQGALGGGAYRSADGGGRKRKGKSGSHAAASDGED